MPLHGSAWRGEGAGSGFAYTDLIVIPDILCSLFRPRIGSALFWLIPVILGLAEASPSVFGPHHRRNYDITAS
jgi:hypothetical protein